MGVAKKVDATNPCVHDTCDLINQSFLFFFFFFEQACILDMLMTVSGIERRVQELLIPNIKCESMKRPKEAALSEVA